MQGNELCFKSELGSFFFFFSQGHGAGIEAEPRAGLGEVLQIKAPFTHSIKNREEEKKTCTFFFLFLFFPFSFEAAVQSGCGGQ